MVELDGAGWASRVRYLNDPDAGAHSELQLSNSPGREGLLDQYTDRRGHVHQMTYDATGQLERDVDLEMGGSWDLGSPAVTHTEEYAEREVTVTSADGRDRVHRIRVYEDLRREREVIEPDGTSTVVETLGDPVREATVTGPDDTVRVSSFEPDPLFGTATMNLATSEVTLPSGASTALSVATDVDFVAGSLQMDTRTVTVTRNVGVTGDERVSTSVSERQPDGSTIVTSTSAEGRRVRQTYDDDGLLLDSVLLLPDDSPAFEPTEYSYDVEGRLTEVRRGTGAGARVFTTHYTDADLPITAPERGYPLGVEDGEGDITMFAWDSALPRLTRTTRADGAVIEFGHDVMGQVSRVRPPERGDHTMSFHGYEGMESYDPPALPGGATTTTWTPGTDRGETDRVDLADGRAIDLSYDATTGKLVSANLTSLATNITYGYDAAGRMNVVTMPQYGGASSITTTLGFDGPLRTSETVTGAPLPALSWSYDEDDELRLRSLTVGTEAPINWTYDADGLLTGAGALTVSPNPDTGLVDSMVAGDVTTAITPNNFGEPATVATTWTGGELSFDFEYDRNGLIDARVERESPASERWDLTHDLAGRLTDIHIDSAPTPTYHYEYDANGNRTAWATPTQTCTSGGATPCTEIDAQDRLLRYDTTTFTYDDHGTLTSKTDGADVTTYDYDELGNLRGVVLPDGTAIDYLIDGRGRRVGRLVDGVVDAYWVYQDALNPVAQLDASGSVEQLYVYANLPHVPALIVEPGGRTLRVVTDQVGSVRRVVDTADGTVVQSIDYSPFGVIEAESATGGFDQPFRFAGGLWDADTELVRFGARDYDPRVGRWTAKDPIGFAAGDSNLYVYVFNRPNNGVDPSGLWYVRIGVTVSVGLLTVGSFELGDFYGTNDRGDFVTGSYREYGGGPGVRMEFSTGITIGFSRASTDSIGGPGTSFCAGGKFLGGGSIEIAQEGYLDQLTEADRNTPVDISGEFGPGFGSGAGMMITETDMWYSDVALMGPRTRKYIRKHGLKP